jgi:hypothetical protein
MSDDSEILIQPTCWGTTYGDYHDDSNHPDGFEGNARCIAGCKECEKFCLALEKSGGLDSITIQTAKDCAEICRTCSHFVTRESHFAADFRTLCAKVCKQCAVAFEKIPRDTIARECAAACRRCAEACVIVGSPVYALRRRVSLHHSVVELLLCGFQPLS